MTFEEAVDLAARQHLYLANLGLRSSGRWEVSLRRQLDLPFSLTAGRTVYVRKGEGSTPAAAIENAMGVNQFEYLLG